MFGSDLGDDDGRGHAPTHHIRASLASLRLDLAALRLHILFCKAGFNPNQPRVPPGNPDGGRWTDSGIGGQPGRSFRVAQGTGRRSSSIPVRVGGRTMDATRSQATRLVFSRVRRDIALERVRAVDPTWRPRPQSFQSVEGTIRANTAIARQAEARLRDLERARLGHNQGPPLGSKPRVGTGTPSTIPFDGARVNSAFRATIGMPPLESGTATSRYDGTVAVGNVDGDIVVGVNSRSPGYTSADEAAAKAMRDLLIARYPDVMATRNVGHKPNDALFHAEATALMRAAEAHGGSLAGRSITIAVDRRLCRSCEKVLPLVTRQLGRPTVRIIDQNGKVLLIRDGRWIIRRK